jgi:hypothetical protein
MTANTGQGHEPAALDKLTERYRESLEQPTQAELDRGLDALLDRVSSGHTRRWHVMRWSLVGASMALGALALVHFRSVDRPSASSPELAPLTYRLDGGSVVEGGYLRESGSAGMKVQFNEGSECALLPGTRGQIRSVDKAGARMGIERGTASFQIKRNTGRRWLVDAGPFEVTVTGTVFTVSWDPMDEQFELRLRHGSVVVRGPVSAGEIALRTGQRLLVNLAKAESVISEMQPGTDEAVAPAAPSSEPQPSATGGKPTMPRPSPASMARLGSDRRWSDDLARGHWDRILVEAKRMGIDAALAKASSEDLFALADAARYRRQPDLARAALLAERRRFPDSPRSLDAIFLLGRVEELRERGATQAITWYDEYLTRAPAGPFVGEALGRKMTLTDRLQGPARAHPIAEEYLRRFPKGNYAGAARTLLRAP